MTRYSIFIALALAGCEEFTPQWESNDLAYGHASQARQQLERGRDVYGTYCVGCHGEQGDGEGPAARFLEPKPRDFRPGQLKFAAVASGEAARDEDYLRVIRQGLSGTAMPSFELLSQQEQDAVVAYVRTFSENEDVPGAMVPIPEDPWVDDVEAGIEAGRKAYHAGAQCASCHPAYATRAEIAAWNEEAGRPPEARPNVYESESTESSWGPPIRATDFLIDRVKTGAQVDDLALVVAAGIGGTAMPTWGGSLEPEQLWGLAYYVRSVALMRGTPEAAALTERLQSQPET